MSPVMLVVLVLACAAAGVASLRVRDPRVSLALAMLSLVGAAVLLALLGASVVGAHRPNPVDALAFVVLSSAGGGLLFGELGHVQRVHSGAAAVALLATASGVGLTVYAAAI